MTTDYLELTRSFEARDIDASAFRHVDHVGVAYEMLRKHDFIHATAEYAESICAIATAAGVPRKFNATITLAFMSLIAERMATTQHVDYDDFITSNPDLLSKDVLEQWYSPERLSSNLARSIFLMPDNTRPRRAD